MSRGIDYPEVLRRATLGMVHEVLERAAAEGLPGEHHFYLSFQTSHPGVKLSSELARRFPEIMTVVLQHQFWDLRVEPEAFEVTLRFGGDYERLRVPFDALTAFLDPSVPFGLDFTQFAAAAGELEAAADPAEVEAATTLGTEDEESSVEGPADEHGGAVLPFRRRDE